MHRKLMHLGVGVQAVRKYRDLQNNESRVVALDFLRDQPAVPFAFFQDRDIAGPSSHLETCTSLVFVFPCPSDLLAFFASFFEQLGCHGSPS